MRLKNPRFALVAVPRLQFPTSRRSVQLERLILQPFPVEPPPLQRVPGPIRTKRLRLLPPQIPPKRPSEPPLPPRELLWSHGRVFVPGADALVRVSHSPGRS